MSSLFERNPGLWLSLYQRAVVIRLHEGPLRGRLIIHLANTRRSESPPRSIVALARAHDWNLREMCARAGELQRVLDRNSSHERVQRISFGELESFLRSLTQRNRNEI